LGVGLHCGRCCKVVDQQNFESYAYLFKIMKEVLLLSDKTQVNKQISLIFWPKIQHHKIETIQTQEKARHKSVCSEVLLRSQGLVYLRSKLLRKKSLCLFQPYLFFEWLAKLRFEGSYKIYQGNTNFPNHSIELWCFNKRCLTI